MYTRPYVHTSIHAIRFLLGSSVRSALIRSHSGSRYLRDGDPARSGRIPVRPFGGLGLPYRFVSHREGHPAGYMADRAACANRSAGMAGCATDRDSASGRRGHRVREGVPERRLAGSDAHEERLPPSDGHRSLRRTRWLCSWQIARRTCG